MIGSLFTSSSKGGKFPNTKIVRIYGINPLIKVIYDTTTPSNESITHQLVATLAFGPYAARAKSSYRSDLVFTAHEIKSIPVYILNPDPSTIIKLPGKMPRYKSTEGNVIVPAPRVATISENIDAKTVPGPKLSCVMN